MRLFHVYFLLQRIQCFCGYMSKAPAAITPLLMRLFRTKIYFLITLYPMFLWLYAQGTSNN